MGIIPSIKERFKGFFHQSRKMVQAPKELPPIGVAGGAPAAETEPQKPKISPPLPPPREQIQGTSMPIQKPLTIQQPQLAQPKQAKQLSLPKIQAPMLRETSQLPAKPPAIVHEDELKKFEEAINKINIDIIHTEAPSTAATPAAPIKRAIVEEGAEEYYKPSAMGEGYFSEIEHYVKNKDVNEIIDDVLKKDFLTSMKDYHENKAQGKSYYLHKQDLKNKLQNKMERLRRLEEEWHSLKTRVEEEEKLKKEIEKRIDSESQELKELFKQVRMTQWLEQEAPQEQIFRLKGGEELKSLNELRKALNYMTDEEFSHHVTPERNDFATWVKETLKNQELYEKIKGIKTKADLQAILQSPV